MAERKLNGIPDVAQIWKVGSTNYVIFVVPGSSPPIYLGYTATPAETQAFFGPDQKIVYDKTIDWAQWKSIGALTFGTTDAIPDISENPFATWERNMSVQSQTQPWILDRDYQRITAAAVIEGRTLTPAEIQSTTWWKNSNKEQREWMKLWHGDRKTAQSRIDDNRIRVLAALREAGVANASAALVNYMADQVTMGNWSVAKYEQQVLAIADPYSGYKLDAGLAAKFATISSLDHTHEHELEVAELVDRWLGPVHGGWDTAQIESWAGKIRNDPDAKDNLVRFLQTQRVALFPEYADETLTYDDIAAPWRNFMENVWGQTPDETDGIFSQLIKNNDITANGALLRGEGYRRGVGKVVQDSQRALLDVGGGSVRRVINA